MNIDYIKELSNKKQKDTIQYLSMINVSKDRLYFPTFSVYFYNKILKESNSSGFDFSITKEIAEKIYIFYENFIFCLSKKYGEKLFDTEIYEEIYSYFNSVNSFKLNGFEVKYGIEFIKNDKEYLINYGKLSDKKISIGINIGKSYIPLLNSSDYISMLKWLYLTCYHEADHYIQFVVFGRNASSNKIEYPLTFEEISANKTGIVAELDFCLRNGYKFDTLQDFLNQSELWRAYLYVMNRPEYGNKFLKDKNKILQKLNYHWLKCKNKL